MGGLDNIRVRLSTNGNNLYISIEDESSEGAAGSRQEAGFDLMEADDLKGVINEFVALMEAHDEWAGK